MSELDPHEGAPAPAADAPAAFTITEDKNQVKVGEATYVRQEALHNERQARQELQRQVDQIAPYVDEFGQFLADKQARTTAQAARVAPSSGVTADQDELEGLARIQGYLDAEGKPDLARAQQYLDFLDRRTGAHVGRAVAPVAKTAAEERAARNRETARTRQYVDGQPLAAQQFIDQAFDSLPPELASDPNVANIVSVIAVGLEALDARKSGRAARREPAFHEGGRGRLDGGNGELTDFDIRAAQARGKTAAEWSKLIGKPTTDARPERDGSFILEDGL